MLLEGRGYFWLAQDPIPSGRIGPRSAVPGHLTVEDDGTSRIALDDVLPLSKDHGTWLPFPSQAPVEAMIAGVLVGTDQRVLLDRLIHTGRSRKSLGLSQDFYTASHCLIAPKGFVLAPGMRFRWLELDLEPYSDWLGGHGIEVSVGRRSITARYRRVEPIRWQIGSRVLELVRSLDGRGDGRLHQISWREQNLLRIGSRLPAMTASAAASLTGQIEDLLTLLADCDSRLAFPTVRVSRRSSPVTLYYSRIPRAERHAEWHKAWASFGAIKPSLGQITEAWLECYDRIGAGFYLYLGNRRGLKMYSEHRFASLAWGMEALHRSIYPPTKNDRLTKKVERIIGNIELEKDKVWAEGKLRGVGEPSLGTRISTLVRALPINISPREAAEFGDQCAKLRNDISHFGGPRDTAGYEDFAKRLSRFTAALEILYHALLLQQAGLPTEFIRARFDGGLHSPAAAAVLADCGLTVAGWKPKPATGSTEG